MYQKPSHHSASRMFTHSLFSFQRSNAFSHRHSFASVTFISYHFRTNFASTFFKFLWKLVFTGLPHRVNCVFLAGIRIYHVENFNASVFSNFFYYLTLNYSWTHLITNILINVNLLTTILKKDPLVMRRSSHYKSNYASNLILLEYITVFVASN